MGGIGYVKELWRYPVSSLGGEMCEQLSVGLKGVYCDRHYALFDPSRGTVAAPEKEPRWRPALFLRSAIDDGGVRIGFPEGNWFHLSDKHLLDRLSSHFGFNVLIGRYPHEVSAFSSFLPTVQNRYEKSPLHLVTTASLRRLEQLVPETALGSRRFRPNILVDTGSEIGFVDAVLLQTRFNIASVEARMSEETKRCGMTFIPQPDLAEQPDILRTIVRQNRRSLGVYCDVIKPGQVKAGDKIAVAMQCCSPDDI